MLFCALMVLVSAAFADMTASIFVKDASEFQTIQKDLESLKDGLGQNNPELEALWERANRIAKINDKCSMISINDVLDDECSHFYAVELPEFESKYMEVTGELRLGAMKMGSTLAERTEQIKACAAALGGILVSKEQLLKLNGSVDLEPLSFEGAFDATYNFNLYFDANRMQQQTKMMNRWLEKCGDIVLRKAGDEFAPLFLQSVKGINDSLRNNSANIQIVLEPEVLDFYLDLNRPVAGSYYLNGARLFNVTALPMGRKHSHLIVNFQEKKVNLPMGEDGEMQHFRGRVEFTSAYQEKDLMGRWTWGKTDGEINEAVAKGEISAVAVMGDSTLPPPVVKHLKGPNEADEDEMETMAKEESAALAASVAAKSAASDASAASAEEPSAEKGSRFKVHVVPLAIAGAVAVGGGIMAAVFNSKAASEREKRPSSPEEYSDRLDKIESAQTLRAVGLGLMAAGIVGAGVTFFF